MAKNKKRADGRYSCQVYLGKDPDGKRKYKTFYGSTLREAKAAADDFRAAMGAEAIKELSLEPYIVSESSGKQTFEAGLMKKVYFGL